MFSDRVQEQDDKRKKAEQEQDDKRKKAEQAKRERVATAELISALTSREPESRPPAKDAMQTPFFAVLKDVSTKVTQTCAFCEMNGDDAVCEADEGIQCSEGHFHCGSCLTRLTKDLLKVENQSQLAQREAQVMCFKFPRECRALGFHAGDLARHLPV